MISYYYSSENMFFNVADFTLSVNTYIMFRVERTLFLIPRSTRFFSFKGLIKGSSCHSCPTKLFDSKGSSPTKQINKNI